MLQQRLQPRVLPPGPLPPASGKATGALPGVEDAACRADREAARQRAVDDGFGGSIGTSAPWSPTGTQLAGGLSEELNDVRARDPAPCCTRGEAHMIATVQDHDVLDPPVAPCTQLRGVLRRQGSDYLLEEPPVPALPWPTGRIWRVDVAAGTAIELEPLLDHVIAVDAAPHYVADRHVVVMGITSVHAV